MQINPVFLIVFGILLVISITWGFVSGKKLTNTRPSGGNGKDYSDSILRDVLKNQELTFQFTIRIKKII